MTPRLRWEARPPASVGTARRAVRLAAATRVLRDAAVSARPPCRRSARPPASVGTARRAVRLAAADNVTEE